MRGIIGARRSAAVLVTAALVAVPVAGAQASTTRQDAYYEIWCQTADSSTYLAKRVDGRAIQPDKNPGGKDTATERYNENNPFGEICEEIGPISP